MTSDPTVGTPENPELKAMAEAMYKAMWEADTSAAWVDETEDMSSVGVDGDVNLLEVAEAARDALMAYRQRTLADEVTELRKALALAGAPLQVLVMSGRINHLSPELAQAVVDGLAAVDEVLEATGGGE